MQTASAPYRPAPAQAELQLAYANQNKFAKQLSTGNTRKLPEMILFSN